MMLRRALLDSFRRSVSDLKTEVEIKKQNVLEKFKQKAVRVALLGASSPTGEALALLLKGNPLISHLFLQGDGARGVAMELSHIDTRTMVAGYYEKDTDKAVRSAEIIVILGTSKFGDKITTADEKIRNEHERLISLARTCTLYAPKAILYICVPPISLSVPLVAGVYKKTNWYHPGKIIGSVAYHQVRVNSILARYNDLDPSGVHVPIVGGPDQDCLVPLFSRATPIGCTMCDAKVLTKVLRNIQQHDTVYKEMKKMEFCDGSPIARAYALNRSITTMALGILGDQNANMAGFIRSNILPTCRHLVSTLRMGPHGVYHNYGLPVLTRIELLLVEQAALLLDRREKEALVMLERADEKKIGLAQ